MKPISYTDFMQAVNKSVNWFELHEKGKSITSDTTSSDQEFIYVKSDYKLIQIPLDRILYIEGLKDYIKIHIEGEQKAVLSLIKHEDDGRTTSFKSFHTYTQIIHCTKKQN